MRACLFFAALLFLPPLTAQAQELPPAVYKGEVQAGQLFTQPLPDHFLFALQPDAQGWQIEVYPASMTRTNNCTEMRCPNMASITLPLHGPNATQIAGWHLRNADNTGPNDGTTNAPGTEREFVFALNPADQSAIMQSYACTMQGGTDCSDVSQLPVGRAKFVIDDYALTAPVKGEQAEFKHMKFTLTALPAKPLGQQ